MCKDINGDLNKDHKVKNVKTKFGQVSSVEMDLVLNIHRYINPQQYLATHMATPQFSVMWPFAK